MACCPHCHTSPLFSQFTRFLPLAPGAVGQQAHSAPGFWFRSGLVQVLSGPWVTVEDASDWWAKTSRRGNQTRKAFLKISPCIIWKGHIQLCGGGDRDPSGWETLHISMTETYECVTGLNNQNYSLLCHESFRWEPVSSEASVCILIFFFLHSWEGFLPPQTPPCEVHPFH